MPPHERRALRVPINLPVVLVHAGSRFDVVAANLSLGGVFVEPSLGLSYGNRVELTLQPPEVRELVRLPGVVRWTNASGFGVQFQQLGARETHALSMLMTAFRLSQAAVSGPSQSAAAK